MNTDKDPKAPAKRTIEGPTTGIAEPHGIFVDSKANEIYVVNLGRKVVEDKATGLPVGSTAPPSITVYARTARGDAAPLRTIQGSNTQLDNVKPIFVDAERHEIVVADGSPTDALLFFDQKANGNAAPVRVIQGSDTGLSNPTGVFVDAKHNEVLVAELFDDVDPGIEAQARRAVLRIRVISPTRSRVSVGIGNPGAIYVDPDRDEIGVPN